MLQEASPQLPPAALWPATLVLFVLLLRAVMKTPHASGKLLLIIVWLRFVMQAYHEITFVSVGGISINAIASLAVCAIGGLVMWRRLPELLRFPVIIALMLVIVASGAMNGVVEPTIENLLKWGYFAIVMLAIQDCFRRDGDARILGLLLWSFAPPLIFQLLSLGLQVGKATESDGSVSFIGGYNHEAAFSIVLVTCFAVAAFAPRLNFMVRLGVLGLCLAGVFAANYRTALIALAPIAFGYLVFGAARNFSKGKRVVMSLIGLLAMAGAIIGANFVLSDRLSDLGTVAGDSGELIRNPAEFNDAERDLMSGRLYLWNRYIDEYASGPDTELLLGNGADSWIEEFGLYAHNTIVSYLFEFGLAGAVLIVLVWIAMIARTLRVRDWAMRGQLLATHVGFVLLNMATMPFWQIEGLILYGILCGYTICVAPARVRMPRPLRKAPPDATNVVDVYGTRAPAFAGQRAFTGKVLDQS